MLFKSIFAFGFGYFIAWALQHTPIPSAISHGLNLVLNTSRFSADNLSYVLGTFGLLAAFFVPNLSIEKKDN